VRLGVDSRAQGMPGGNRGIGDGVVIRHGGGAVASIIR
jgi:hypothetical protein